MHRVLPMDSGLPDIPASRAPNIPWTLVGCSYITLSIICSVWYLYVVQPSLSNDVWWANYSSSRDQALVIDIFNAILPSQSSGALDIFSPRATIGRPYTAVIPSTAVYSTYPRQLVLTELTSVEYAVQNLRSLDAPNSLWMGTQYCWVDFQKRFEIAHTETRQTRCRDRYRSNGAVYMESMLRNQVWDDFMSFYGAVFEIAVQDWLVQSEDGRRWVATTSSARPTTTAAEEVALWTENGITSFTLQWQNDFVNGMSDAIVLVNALGMQQELVLRSVSYAEVTWTSVILYWTIMNDMYYMYLTNRSLIRSANNSFLQHPEVVMDSMPTNVGEYLTQVDAFRASIGPFFCVDAFVVPVPPTVVALYRQFEDIVLAMARLNVDIDFAADAIQGTTLSPTPPSWTRQDRLFYGGNPLCLRGAPQVYVQNTFGFHDLCDKQTPLSLDYNLHASLFAVQATKRVQVDDICAVVAAPESCRRLCQSILEVEKHLPPVPASFTALFDDVFHQVTLLNVGIMQFASSVDGFNMTILFEPLLQDPAFQFFGWFFIYEWVSGRREVVRFDGDVASLTLMSVAESPVQFFSGAESIASATHGLYYVVVYVTAILATICTASLVSTLAFGTSKLQTSEFLWFNHVVGSVWIGRPLLLLRGGTAILVLSTTQLHLATINGVHSHFEFRPRYWFSTCVIAGEATWALYVAVDFLTVVTSHFTRSYAPLSCVIAWSVLVLVELTVPVLPWAWIDRVCTGQNMDQAIKCSSGGIRMGSFDRVRLILLIQSLSICAAMAISLVYKTVLERRHPVPAIRFQRYILGVADNYFPLEVSDLDDLASQNFASQLMAGLIPWRRGGLFDIKLWLHDTSHSRIARKATIANFSQLQPSPPYEKYLSKKSQQRLQRVGELAAVLYAVGGIVGSVLYFQVAQVNLANDLYWATFNMSGMHVFMSNWLNDELYLGVRKTETAMDVEYINQDGSFDQDSSRIMSPSNFGQMLLYTELNAIQDAIVGLRASDACEVPWISTQYCFVDFDQRWDLANTAARQQRCRRMTSNGAVFLESVWRNIDCREFARCWGHAIDAAIVNDLKQSTAGQDWLNEVFADEKPSVSTEIAFWKTHGVSHFTTQWQNYKTIGLVNNYAVTNVYGISYPFTLQNEYSRFRFESETTFKMYWAFASDLAAVSNNATAIAGHSLIRSSSLFAFANTSMQSLLMENGTVSSPLPNAYRLLQSELGSFGSVDVTYVPCPSILKGVARQVFTTLRQSLAQSDAAQVAYFNLPSGLNLMNPVPRQWIDLKFNSVSGSILCPEAQPSPVGTGLQGFVAWHRQCSFTPMYAAVAFDQQNALLAALLSQLPLRNTPEFLASICRHDGTGNPLCMKYLASIIAFIDTYIHNRIDKHVVASMVAQAIDAVVALNVEFVQYGRLDEASPLTLYRSLVFNPSDESFEFFSWVFLVDWVVGYREVVSFEGDVGNITLLTEYQPFVKDHVSMVQFPVNLASYLRNVVLYVTSTMIFLAVLLLVYIALSHGHVDVMNLFKLQRVGAIVWVGRPLLFVRSLTAIGVLSTASLELHFSGYITFFTSAQVPWYMTILAANEITWLVAIVNDMALVLTQEYTPHYATGNTMLVWLFTATLSIAIPTSHAMVVDKQCQVAAMDSLVVCTSGHLAIGQPLRLVGMVGAVLTCNALCYFAARHVMDKPESTPLKSVFLYAGAKYMFSTADWIDGHIYYMDRMSAAMNGILTIRRGTVMYGLDIKLWRTLHVNLADTSPHTTAAHFALPLHMSNRYSG
ncbi:hypothetical protein H257_08255 [Aphanomyces astaci]|uniref:Uncharacterized protein n=1 Tax=Aphanomyces astaci TaxID=112090 RepID=W4GEE0_APHAT|nr:hypothetical protein H257_08255 [Aphanomyces astaci]ETV78040.1 hypothetical protein H257_08255 [Aphanomyces astaci]|eukprot:XP_009832377.1 hypothetical protein H257_08255 [Aphanomyces astaci]